MKRQTVKIKDYGDDWLNRLALVLTTIEKMGPTEREASLEFIVSKYLKRTYGASYDVQRLPSDRPQAWPLDGVPTRSMMTNHILHFQWAYRGRWASSRFG